MCPTQSWCKQREGSSFKNIYVILVFQQTKTNKNAKSNTHQREAAMIMCKELRAGFPHPWHIDTGGWTILCYWGPVLHCGMFSKHWTPPTRCQKAPSTRCNNQLCVQTYSTLGAQQFAQNWVLTVWPWACKCLSSLWRLFLLLCKMEKQTKNH